MKSIKKAPLTKPLLKKLIDQHKTNSKVLKQNSKVGPSPLKPAELGQDSGAGYNSDHTFPQG